MSIVYLNGQFLGSGEAHVGVTDGGFLHGAGLFETIRVEDGRPFRLEAHIDRLRNSASKLLQPISREQLPDTAIVAELLERNALRDARLRLTVTAGPMIERLEVPAPGMTVCLTASPLTAYPPALYEQGVTVVICQFRQSQGDPTGGHKTTSYLPRLLGLREAHAARCMEAIWFTNSNQLAEGSISNVFVVRSGRLLTPPLHTPVLPGIARAVVFEEAAKLGIDAAEKALTINDLLDAEEVLLTNSIMQVMPVTRVEKRDIAGGRVGPLARKLLAAYREATRRE